MYRKGIFQDFINLEFLVVIMLWALFTLLAAFSWAISSIIDKYVLTKIVRNPYIPVIYLGIIGLVLSFSIYIFRGFSFLSWFNILLCLIAGFFFLLVHVFYFKAVNVEEVSRVVPLFQLSSVFVLVFAAFFLGEIFTLIQYFGIFLLITGSVLVSSKNIKKPRLGSAFWFMLLAAFFVSFSVVLRKYLLSFSDFWTIFSYSWIGTSLASIPVFYLNFKDFSSSLNKKAVTCMTSAGLISVLGSLSFTAAMSFGFVTLVSALSSVRPFFVLFIVLLLSVFFPKILKEELKKSVFLTKLMAIAIVVAGTILIL